MRNAGADRGKGDGSQTPLIRDLEAAPRRPAQALGGGAAAEPHAGGVDHVTGFEPAAAGNRRVADLDWADGPALRLDRRAACPGDGARDSTSQLEVVVRGVDDGIDILSGEIALLDLNGKAVDAPAHAVG